MSKKSVWNRGKHNGGGLTSPKKQADSASLNKDQSETNNEIKNENLDSPINRVGRMNRENWVVRPVRDKRDN